MSSKTAINHLTPTVTIWVQLLSILYQYGGVKGLKDQCPQQNVDDSQASMSTL